MKTAKKMFEELGFEVSHSSYFIQVRRKDEVLCVAWFSKTEQRYGIRTEPLTPQWHFAIHQQMKELGWIE